MPQLLSAAQMRRVEGAAIDSGRVTGQELMERAGQGVVQAMFTHRPEWAQTQHRAVVLCGPGNNGGDGYVIARLLSQWGWRVAVYALGDPELGPPDAHANYLRWIQHGPVGDLKDAPCDAASADVFVDAMFGTGLTRPLGGDAARWVRMANADLAMRAKTVAVDLPSGLCSDSGRSLSGDHDMVQAALTVSFHRAKLGHVLADGPSACGQTVVVDIGLTQDEDPQGVSSVAAPCAADLSKGAGDHKYSHGHAVVLSGPVGTGGAARLAARAALRVGAGLVTVACPRAAVSEHAAHLTAVMIKEAGTLPEVAQLLADPRLNAVCFGPGFGTDRVRAFAQVVLGAAGRTGSDKGRGVVLDADALSAFEGDPQTLFDMLNDACVLTPHGGEFARLFPDISKTLAAPPTRGPATSKVDATRAAARRAGCVILFKGPDTVIAAPDGRASVLASTDADAAPWLATAGSGDVLAGLITGLLARGMEPMRATETAAWLHRACARQFGPGLIAEDLPEQIPAVFRALGVGPS